MDTKNIIGEYQYGFMEETGVYMMWTEKEFLGASKLQITTGGGGVFEFEEHFLNED